MSTRDETPTHAISFDLEHWHSATLLQSSTDDPVDRIEDSLDIVLGLLQRYDVQATFFVVGEIAETYPDLVQRIRDDGHEVGSHGHTHTSLFELTRTEFETELEQSAAAIKAACGDVPHGFRAPNFSITRQTEWAFRTLEASSYQYDSSVFPVRTPLYGVSGAPIRTYTPAAETPFRPAAPGEEQYVIREIPLSVLGPWCRLPIAGGFYARLLPAWVLRHGIRRLEQRGIRANLYFHPWEFNPDVELDSAPLRSRFVSFHGIETLESKVAGLLSTFEWGPVRQLLDNEPSYQSGGRTVGPTRDPVNRQDITLMEDHDA